MIWRSYFKLLAYETLNERLLLENCLKCMQQEIFESSEVNEKRELVNLVFQNLKLEGKKPLTEVCEPFSTMIGYKDCPTNWRWRESNNRLLNLN